MTQQIETAIRDKKTPQFIQPATLGWCAIVLTFMAWAALMWLNGYVAIGISVAAIIAGTLALKTNKRKMHHATIATILANIILLTILIAFLIVTEIALKG